MGACDENKLVELLSSNKNLYEILRSTDPRKIYVDLDCETDKLNEAKIILLSKFPNAKFAVSGSDGTYKGKNKYSRHIIITNYFFKSLSDMLKFKIWLKIDIFDTNVYSASQSFKCVNQSKANDGKFRKLLKMMIFLIILSNIFLMIVLMQIL